MKGSIPILFFLCISSWLILACNLDQAIELKLPEYESRIAVEGYLKAGKPFGVLLTRSSGYFDPFNLNGNQLLTDLLVEDAIVTIKQGEKVYELENKLTLDRFTGKVFNYYLDRAVPANYDEVFELEILTAVGDRITSSTQLLKPIEIDSVNIEFDPDDPALARVLTYFTDPPNETNYYRRMLHEGSLDSLAFQDFSTSDRVAENVVVFGTRYVFEVGDTIINTLFHVSEDYYNFLESVQGAAQANGNPFAQPSPIISNIESEIDAFGIFTTLNYDQRITKIKR